VEKIVYEVVGLQPRRAHKKKALPFLLFAPHPLRTAQAIEDLLLSQVSYDEKKQEQLINEICEVCMQQLVEKQKPFKYIGEERPLNRISSKSVRDSPNLPLGCRSFMHHHAEKWGWHPHLQLLLLGHGHGRFVHLRSTVDAQRQIHPAHPLRI